MRWLRCCNEGRAAVKIQYSVVGKALTSSPPSTLVSSCSSSPRTRLSGGPLKSRFRFCFLFGCVQGALAKDVSTTDYAFVRTVSSREKIVEHAQSNGSNISCFLRASDRSEVIPSTITLFFIPLDLFLFPFFFLF